MLTISIRLIFIYCFTLLCARIMGKRQMGELELPELVSAFFLSETATYYVTDLDSPITYGVIPILTITLLEIIVSSLSVKLPIIKRLTDSAPSFLIYKHKINQKALEKSRISITELFSQMRQKGFTDLEQVQYAVLEADGKISIIPSDAYAPVVKNDLSLPLKEIDMTHIVAIKGKFNKSTLKSIGLSEEALKTMIKNQKLGNAEKYYAITYSEDGKLKGIRKET